MKQILYKLPQYLQIEIVLCWFVNEKFEVHVTDMILFTQAL